MTDLTEQLQELSGDYWCEITESPCIERVYFPTCSEDIIVKVLAKVPDYNEWQAKLEENEQLKDLLKECESSIQYYQETYGAMDLDTYTLLAKLKELNK